MDNPDMTSILNLFAEKLMLNLMFPYSNLPQTDKNEQIPNQINSSQNSTFNKQDFHSDKAKQIINATLEVFNSYTSTSSSCKQIGKTMIMNEVISHGANNL